jgi:hypothetical protein
MGDSPKRILPAAKLPTKLDTSYFGPNYDFAASLPMPADVGAVRDNTLSSVFQAGQAAAYYIDMIGFGAPSTAFTANMRNKPRPLGINYFIRTGSQCSNGADMWYYVNGVPDGSALGPLIKEALERSKLPPLRGLAPGILEDAKAGLDPRPVVSAVLGSGYAQCRKVTLPVGDTFGNIRNPKDRDDLWILGPIERINGVPHQTRWIQDVDKKGNPIYLFVDEFDAAPKTQCPNGSNKPANGECPPSTEGFAIRKISPTRDLEGWIVAASLTAAALAAVGKCVLRL